MGEVDFALVHEVEQAAGGSHQNIHAVGNLFPLTYFIPIARGIVSKGIGIGLLWEHVVALLIYIVVIMGFASLVFKRGLD